MPDDDPREVFYHNRVRQTGPQYANFKLLPTELTLELLYTCDLLQVGMRYFAAFGLSRSGLNILMILRHSGTSGMQLHELGELLLVSRANITGLVDHLEQKGYVKRVVDSHDRRARYAHITKKAEALLDEFMPVHYNNLNLLLQDLTDGEKERLIELLEKTRASIRTHASGLCDRALAECPASRE